MARLSNSFGDDNDNDDDDQIDDDKHAIQQQKSERRTRVSLCVHDPISIHGTSSMVMPCYFYLLRSHADAL